MLQIDFKGQRNDVKVIRCRAHDTQWYFALLAAARTIEELPEELPDRINAIGAAGQLEMLKAETSKLANELIMTYPQEKRRTMANHAGAMIFHIDVGPKAAPDKAHTVMDVEALGVLIRYAHDMNCKLCDHPERCSKCDLGRTFDMCLPECRGKGESWQDIDAAGDE